jgi:hypothetical protein
MPIPDKALQQIWRILKADGVLFLSVDIGGVATPDEPTVFSIESLAALLGGYVEIMRQTDDHPPHSWGRVCSVRTVGRKRRRPTLILDKEQLLQAYLRRRGEEG